MTEPAKNVETLTPAHSSSQPRRRWFKYLAIGLSLGLLLAVGLWISSVEKSLRRGRILIAQLREVEAEKELERYLLLHPRDPEAILLWAQAVITGDSRTPTDAANLALTRLADIPDDSPQGAEARMREGRLALLILHQPDRAEKLLNRSAALNPDLADTQYLLWKLLDMTERFYFSASFFWKVYEQTPDESKPERLREWCLSQFSPSSASAEFDRRMGFLGPDQPVNDLTTTIRLQEFMAREPESPMVRAALASWLTRERERDEALRVLTQKPVPEDVFENPHYVSAIVIVLMELGRLDEAQDCFKRWPPPLEGFLYWRAAGRISEIIDRDDAAAIEAYDKALSIWPGPVDWTIMHRKAQCLSRLGQRDAAEEVRVEEKRIEFLMEIDIQRSLRLAIVDLTNQDSLQQMVDFYQAIHCEQESNCWRDAIDRLRQSPAAVY